MQSIITFAGLAFANLAVAGPCKPLPQTTVSSIEIVPTTTAEPTVVTATVVPVPGTSSSGESSAVMSESETGYESSTFVESSTLATVVIQETSTAETSAAETSAETTAADTTTAETSAETSATETSAETSATETSADTTAADTTAAETTAADTTTAETSAETSAAETSAETTAADTTAADTTAADTTAADTTAAETTAAETTAADTTTAETNAETSAAETSADTTAEASTTSVEVETSATQTTTETAAPTADQSCDNGGLDYAIYSHQFYNSDPPRFSSFDATYFHGATPTYQGITERIGIQPNTDWTKPFTIYEGSPSQMYQYKAVNHRGFLYAPESGTYKVTVPNSDEITLVWFGNKAISTWTRANADLEQDYPGGTSKSFSMDLEAGTYTPFRLLWANAQGELNFIAEVKAPSGHVIVNGDGADNKYLVRYSCDGNTPSFPQY